jgi:branched-chain amino acid transport system permease protein
LTDFFSYSVVGIVIGCVYALSAMGLVVTYATSGVFNFAHGAIGMVAAFAYWQLTVPWGWPPLVALVVVVGGLAPAFGVIIYLGLMRNVHGRTLDATLTLTIGLLLLLLALATIIWNPATPRTTPLLFPTHSVHIGAVIVSLHQLCVVAAAILVAGGLRAFLYSSRTGISLRAVVDDPELLALTGATPSRVAATGWALGCSLAALAGVLIAPLLTILDQQTLTFLIINGLAAAVLGRLTSLPLTFVGGLVLGLAGSYAIGYLPQGNALTTIQPILPMLLLIVALLASPRARLAGRTMIARPQRLPSWPIAGGATVVFLIAAVIATQVLSLSNLNNASRGVGLALVFLSLVPLTGYAGQVSLCQLTFAGLGAYAMAKVGGTSGDTLGLLAAIGLSAAVGAVIAIPALRLRGLYLALTTLAFAYAMDTAFFNNSSVVGIDGALNVARFEVPGLNLDNESTYFVSLCVIFAICALGVLALRRSPLGRRLVAMGDSPIAAAVTGMSLVRGKVTVFAISAGIAGLGGALYAGAQGTVGDSDFAVLLSLTVLLLAVAWGIRNIPGMFVGGMIVAFAPTIQQNVPSSLRDVLYLAVGAAAIGIARAPGRSGPRRIALPSRGGGQPPDGESQGPDRTSVGGKVAHAAG